MQGPSEDSVLQVKTSAHVHVQIKPFYAWFNSVNSINTPKCLVYAERKGGGGRVGEGWI